MTTAWSLSATLVCDPNAADTEALLGVVRDGYRPFQVVTLGSPSPEGTQVPLLRDRSLVDGHAAAYVCRNLTCQAPATEPEALQVALRNQ